MSGEAHITILPPSYVSIGQGTWALTGPNVSFYFTWFLYNTTNADGDNISWKVYLDAGEYTLLLLTDTSSNRGIADIDIDAAEVASFDLYSVGAIFNVRKVQAGISIGTAGLKTLKLRVDGKNPSGSGHIVTLCYIALWRTA